MNDTRVSSLLLLTGVMLRVAVPAATGQETWPPDEAQLKAYFMGEFIAIDGYDSDNTRRLKAGGISDEQLRRVLSEIYTESDTAFGRAKDTYERLVSTQRRQNAIRELAVCADETTKAFLLDLAADKTKDGFLRTIAIGSYLSAADAEETRDILMRFLVGDDRMDSQARSSILEHAHTAYREAVLDKKRAILEYLYAALAHEDAKWLFRVYDNILSPLSQQYANSGQRRNILKRLIDAKPTCKADEYALPELEFRLRELQKTQPVTDISTNLTALEARDFSRPPLEGDAVAAAEAKSTSIAPPRVAAVTPLKSLGRYALGGATILILAAASIWFCRKKKR